MRQYPGCDMDTEGINPALGPPCKPRRGAGYPKFAGFGIFGTPGFSGTQRTVIVPRYSGESAPTPVPCFGFASKR